MDSLQGDLSCHGVPRQLNRVTVCPAFSCSDPDTWSIDELSITLNRSFLAAETQGLSCRSEITLVQISSCTQLVACFLPSRVQEIAHVKYVHFSAFLSSQTQLDRLGFSAFPPPAPFFFFTTSAFYLRNTLQEAGVNLGEETIR